ncbi:PepSY domain-containing protein [Paracoccus luteus]|uniref:PepSY domain-containing protein n=1 Tax=Paracoccus luteus TaxID=2508543 RepID=UPI00106F1741|nr:PepSY domain-containing protein [Paracoccus luteus]
MRKIMLATAAVVLGAGIAQADQMTDSIQRDLAGQGFTDIGFDRDDGRLEVDARRGDQRVELIYDAATGALLSQEGRRSDDDDGDDRRRGRGDDDDHDDDNDGRGGRGDDDGDGRGGRGHDDDGGGDDRGGDDRGGDDRGGDDSGGDGRGGDDG